jgi:MFS family permease
VGIGWLAAVASFSAGAGILVGGWLVDHAGWRWIFWFSGGHAALAVVAVALLLPPSARRAATGRLDLLGGVLFAPAVALLLWAITRLKGRRPARPADAHADRRRPARAAVLGPARMAASASR